jgi:hypothetical protein
VSLDPKELQDLLDELERSRRSRKRAWENLQEIRWVLKEAAGIELPPAKRKTIDLEGRVVKDGVRQAVKERQVALADLVNAIRFAVPFEEFSEIRLPLKIPSWNIAPSQNVLAVRNRSDDGKPKFDALKWGLVPGWSKDEKIAYKTINARVETVDTAPAYRQRQFMKD